MPGNNTTFVVCSEKIILLAPDYYLQIKIILYSSPFFNISQNLSVIFITPSAYVNFQISFSQSDFIISGHYILIKPKLFFSIVLPLPG